VAQRAASAAPECRELAVAWSAGYTFYVQLYPAVTLCKPNRKRFTQVNVTVMVRYNKYAVNQPFPSKPSNV